MSAQYQYCSHARRVASSRPAGGFLTAHSITSPDIPVICAVFILPLTMECAMNFRVGAFIPTAVFENRGQMPRFFNGRQTGVDLRLDLPAQHIFVEADRSLVASFAWPFSLEFLGKKSYSSASSRR